MAFEGLHLGVGELLDVNVDRVMDEIAFGTAEEFLFLLERI